MDFKEIVQRRRSIRKFTDKQVSDDDLKIILRAGLMAPTGHSKRAWKFIVVRDKEQLQAISKCKSAGAEFVASSSVAIIVAYDTAATDVWIEDASIAAVTMQYQATELGIGSCWSQIRLRGTEDGVAADTNLRSQFGYDDNFQTLCVLGFGYPDVERKMQDESRLMWDSVVGL